MQRRKVEIAMTHVHRAKADVGKVENEIADQEVKDLCIRVRKTAAIWALRGCLGPSQSTWRIGDLGTLIAPSVARDRAIEAKKLLRRGIDPADWLEEQEAGGRIERTFDLAVDGWTWNYPVERFLIHVKNERRPATYTDYRKTLQSADFQRFSGRLLRSITKRDVSTVIDGIYDRGARAQSNHAL